jgi:hypothetical protein
LKVKLVLNNKLEKNFIILECKEITPNISKIQLYIENMDSQLLVKSEIQLPCTGSTGIDLGTGSPVQG